MSWKLNVPAALLSIRLIYEARSLWVIKTQQEKHQEDEKQAEKKRQEGHHTESSEIINEIETAERARDVLKFRDILVENNIDFVSSSSKLKDVLIHCLFYRLKSLAFDIDIQRDNNDDFDMIQVLLLNCHVPVNSLRPSGGTQTALSYLFAHPYTQPDTNVFSARIVTLLLENGALCNKPAPDTNVVYAFNQKRFDKKTFKKVVGPHMDYICGLVNIVSDYWIDKQPPMLTQIN